MESTPAHGRAPNIGWSQHEKMGAFFFKKIDLVI